MKGTYLFIILATARYRQLRVFRFQLFAGTMKLYIEQKFKSTELAWFNKKKAVPSHNLKNGQNEGIENILAYGQ